MPARPEPFIIEFLAVSNAQKPFQCPACQRVGALTPQRMTVLSAADVVAEYRCPQCQHEWSERWARDRDGRITTDSR